jgi:hypothetical protein
MPDGNGGTVARIGTSLISALPPAFLILALLNIGFIAVMVWFLKDQLQQRDMMAEKLFNRCLEVALHDVP